MKEVFEVSTEILTCAPEIFGTAIAYSCFVVLTAGLMVSCVREPLINTF